MWAFIREINCLTSGPMANQFEELAIFHTLHIPCRPSRAPRVIEVHWSPPSPSWIKVNTDGAAFGCLGLAGSGGIFHNCQGFVHGCFAIPIRVVFTFEAELVEFIQAISFVLVKNWKQLRLEADSMYLVSLFCSRSLVVPWRW